VRKKIAAYTVWLDFAERYGIYNVKWGNRKNKFSEETWRREGFGATRPRGIKSGLQNLAAAWLTIYG